MLYVQWKVIFTLSFLLIKIIYIAYKYQKNYNKSRETGKYLLNSLNLTPFENLYFPPRSLVTDN